MKIKRSKFRLILDQIELGLKSGYPPCCVAWFFIRNNKIIKGNSYDSKRFYEWWYKKESAGRVRGSRHIPCPYHLFVDKRKFEYFKCEECKWEQLYKNKCSFCDGDMNKAQ